MPFPKPVSPRRGNSPRRERSPGPRVSRIESADGPKPQRAFKYLYNAKHETWSRTECSVLIANKAFQEGGMRFCYKMYEIGIDNHYAPGVAKIFKEDVAEDEEELTKAYFDEAMTQTVADSFAKQFNQCLPESHAHYQCRFLPVHVLHLSDQGHTLCNIEPYLSGQYIKHNDNNGHVESDLEVPQAFSHFTWECSKQQLLVCDIQGVGNFFTDPQIHSHDGESFGMGNIGVQGINKFLQSHKCNSICKLLGLRQPYQNAKGKWLVEASSGMKPPAELKRAISGGTPWSSVKYKGVMQQAITKLKSTIRSPKDPESNQDHHTDKELTMQQQEALQQKLMLLVEQKGSLENQMLLSPKRNPMQRSKMSSRENSPARGRSPPRERGQGRSIDPHLHRLSSSFEWDGSAANNEVEDDFTCKHCGIVGSADAVAGTGRHHSEVCPRYHARAPAKQRLLTYRSDGQPSLATEDRWNSTEVRRLQMLLEAQSLRMKGLDMGELQPRCYTYDRP